MKIFCTGRYQMCKDLRRYWAGGSRWICSTLARFIIFSRSPMCICRSRRWINEFVQLSLHRFAAFHQCASTDPRAGGFKNEFVQLSLHQFATFPHGAITRLLHKCQISSKGWTQLSNFKSDYSGHILNRLNFLADVLFGVNVLISQNTSISSSNFPCGS